MVEVHGRVAYSSRQKTFKGGQGTTTNPRHRFLLMAYDRHRNLEMAGRFDEIFAPEMMAEKPVYHVHADKTNAKLEGQDAVKSHRERASRRRRHFYCFRDDRLSAGVWLVIDREQNIIPPSRLPIRCGSQESA